MELETETKAETLKQYIGRLDQGESLASVQADFVKNFSGVSAGDIAKAEEAMIQSGTPLRAIRVAAVCRNTLGLASWTRASRAMCRIGW